MLAYALALLKVSGAAPAPCTPISVIDGKPEWSGRVYQVGVGNGRFHGGGLRVAPDAAIDDGRLDIYLVQPGVFWSCCDRSLHLKFNLAAAEGADADDRQARLGPHAAPASGRRRWGSC